MTGDTATEAAEDAAVTDLISAHARLTARMGALGSTSALRTEPLAAAELAALDQLGAALAHASKVVEVARA